MKCVFIVLLVLGFFWNLPVGPQEWSVRNGGYLGLFNMLVCLTALLVVAQAFREHKYSWAAGFVMIAVLFNPIVPVTLSWKMFLELDSLCIMTFLVSFQRRADAQQGRAFDVLCDPPEAARAAQQASGPAFLKRLGQRPEEL